MTGDTDPPAPGRRPRAGAGAFLLLVPALCCGGPLLVAALAADAGLTAWAAAHGALMGAGGLLLAGTGALLLWRRNVRRETAHCVTRYGSGRR